MHRILLLSTGFATALAAGSASAQDAVAPPLSVVEMEVQRYQGVTLGGDTAGLPCCAAFTIYEPGMVVVHVSTIMDVGWSEEFDRLSVNARDIVLEVAGADEPLPMIGHSDVVGIIEIGATGLFASRPNDWPDEDRQVALSGYWLVPDAATAATLLLGEEEARTRVDLDLSAEVTRPAGPGAGLSVQSLELERVPGFEGTVRAAGAADVPGFLRVTAGQVLRLDLSVLPGGSNQIEGGRNFDLFSEELMLVGPDGLPLTELGAEGAFGFQRNDNFNEGWSEGREPDAIEEVMYFLGSGAPGTYRLFYVTDPIGEVELAPEG